MSISPPPRRLSTTSNSSKREEDLINAYEAEEERIINVLSRKLEQLREEKITLENVLEAESENHVNRLNRELLALRLSQQQQANGTATTSPPSSAGLQTFLSVTDPASPSPEMMLEAMRRENEQLRRRLVDTERDYIRISRLNEIYREELIDHRRRLGLPVDNLIGLASLDPYSQPTHRRPSSVTSSPSTSILVLPTPSRSTTQGVPIPRPSSTVHRPLAGTSTDAYTPLSHSSSSAESPYPFSPIASANTASYVSNVTSVTTPPSSTSFNFNPASHLNIAASSRQLSYPVVPPPSLSSSLGSPNIVYHGSHRDPSLSPVEPLSPRMSARRRNSDRRVAESGHFRSPSSSLSRRASVERGARIAETGVLIPRSRASSQSLRRSTTETPTVEEGFELDNIDLHQQTPST